MGRILRLVSCSFFAAWGLGLAYAAENQTLPPAIADFEVRRNPVLSGRRAAFYIDDVIWLFRDLTRNPPKRLFDNPFLKVLKDAHDRYGMKVQLNCFYRTDFFYGTDEFTLAEMSDRYKAEWQASKDWLRLGFHSLQEFPDYPFVNADYADVKSVVEKIRGEVMRFAGEGVFTLGAVVHWGACSKDACKALHDMGFGVVLATCGPRVAYGGDPSILPYGHAMRLLQNRKPETCLYRRLSEDVAISSSIGGYNNLTTEQAKRTFGVFDYIYDRDLKIGFKELEDLQPLSAGINLYTLKDIPAELDKVIGREFVVYSYHEQYFYRDYLAYQPDYAEKVMLCARTLHDAGYGYMFFEELAAQPKPELSPKPLVVGIADRCTRPAAPQTSYIDALAACGHIPVLIGRCKDPERLAKVLSRIDVLLLSGGQDIDTSRYGETRGPSGEPDLDRDDFEFMLLGEAVKLKKPVFGICRGLQLINVFFGGTLYRDIPSEYTLPEGVKPCSHRFGNWEDAGKGPPAHYVTIDRASRLFAATGAERLAVNSHHHQGVKKLAPGFRVTARATDGFVEAIEGDTYPAAGVQFHPEELVIGSPSDPHYDLARIAAMLKDIGKICGK